MAVSIDIRADPPDLARLEAAVAEVGAWLERVDGRFSTFKDDSDVSRIARGELDIGAAGHDVAEVLALGERFRAATGGYFDVRASGRLDPSGVVKGWAVERASELLLAAGFPDHAVNAGGDIRMRGRPGPGRGWRVGIAHPHVRGGLAAVAEVADGAVATSGTAERGAHVVDPHTGRAALELASVTVVGAELVATDVYATAALAMGRDAPAWLAGLAGHEAFVVGADATTWHTPGFPFAS
jgi:thiamine biosynthesis lipoprotein